MSGWHSLSGSLQYRTGGGLSILKSKKKLWFMFEESQCQLKLYNSESDARKKPPIGHIDLKGAAISLDIEQHNQFIIITDSKDHIFTAENHESLMIWLIGLQAKRDAYLNRCTSKPKLRACSSLPQDLDSRQRRGSEFSASSLFRNNADQDHLKRSNTISDPHGNPLLLRSGGRSLRQADSLDSVMGSCDRAVCESQLRHQTVRQVSRSVTECNDVTEEPSHEQLWLRRGSSSSGSMSQQEDNDEVFGEHNHPKTSEEKLKLLRQNHVTTVDGLSDCLAKNCAANMNGYERTSSCSGLSSGSTDSAIDKGPPDVQQELMMRMTDLEQELITTKCELAKVLNQQTFFHDMLEKKDAIIYELDQTLDQLGVADIKRQLLYGGKFFSTKKGKVLEEKVRVLQNQNRFLNEEVKRLAKLRQSEQDRYREQEERIRHYEADIEGWKRNYVSIVQSCIHYPTGDSMDGAEVTLYGEDMHKATIKGLLTEARRTNPSLPTFERLAGSPHHVDNYGFKHSHENMGLLLHYICQQLNQHYTMQLANYEAHQLRWKDFLCQHRVFDRSDKELKLLCRGGIPHQYRKEVWRRLVHTQVEDLRKEKGPHFFRNLCNSLPDSQLAARYRKQISLDLMRTMPSNVKFCSAGSKGIRDLQDVLLAFCIHNPCVGYCQGLNFIVAMSLLIMDPPDAFWTLVAVSEKYFSPNYFNHNLIGAQADQEVLREIILDKLPKLYHHLESLDIEISTVTLNWFMAIFFDAVPFETLLRLWDCFLLEGPKVLFRFSLAILKLHENDLLQKTDTISLMRHLKACAKLTYDVDGLIKTAYEDMAPFPSRRDISVKQTCYLNVLKEKYKKREWHKRAYVEREQMLLEQKADSENSMLIECVAEYAEGKLWLCHTENNVSKVCKVNCNENMMYNLTLEFDARVLCMTALRENIILIGTVAWTLFAFDTRSREEKWELQLHDAVLALCVLKEGKHRRVFAALADGTVAVLENVSSSPPKTDVFYIPVGKSSVTSMTLFNDQLWCASGNVVYVLHARTLDMMDNFTVSANPYDQVLTLVPGDYGFWISLKGSSILELWDTKTLSCKMLYDTRSGRYPNLRKEDDSYFNKARITSIHSYSNTVMVGTGDGVLITFEVVEKVPVKTSPEGSSCSESRSSSPCYSSVTRERQSPSVALNSVNGATDKVKDYIERLERPYQRDFTCRDENLTWGTNLDDLSSRNDVLCDFDTMSYPSSLACSEISNYISTTDTSVQAKGDNSDTGQEKDLEMLKTADSTRDVLKMVNSSTAHKVCNKEKNLSDAESSCQDLPSSSTPVADGMTLFTRDDLELYPSTEKAEGSEPMQNETSVFYKEGEITDSHCHETIPQINVNGENLATDQEKSESTSEENSLMTSLTSNESFKSCDDKDSPSKSTTESAVECSAEFASCTNSQQEFFEDEVFCEITNDLSDMNLTTATNFTKQTVTGLLGPKSSTPNKDRSRSRPLKIKRRSKKLSSEVQYRLDFSDMKLSIDSTVSSSSYSERKSSLLSNCYPSDSSLDQLKNSLKGENSTSLTELYTKSYCKAGFSPPIIVASPKKTSSYFKEISSFKRVSSLDTHMDSIGLSSFEEISSHKELESSETKEQLTVSRVQISHNSSCTSLCSLTEAQLYAFDLVLQSKVKISDKPVKCLLQTSLNKEQVIVSCAGSFGDDEAVLRWRKEADEKIWTNEPIYEICQTTKRARLPTYMRGRLSSVSSSQSGDSVTSGGSVVALNMT